MDYKKGDYVQIVPKRPYRCAAGWVSEMEEFCGKIATLVSEHYDEPWWRIDIDGGEWWWSPDCFAEKIPELPDLDTVPPETFQILFG